jgi:hypothetical protein
MSASATAATRSTDERSMRSIGTGRQVRPSASISAAVVSRLPAMGIGSSGTRVLEAWARPSPSCTVRAVITTSKPRRARARAAQRPMPRLAPVTSATRSVLQASATYIIPAIW